MRRTLIVFAALTFVSAFAHGQSACAQLGVDCSHPNIEQRPSAPACDAACRQAAQQRSNEYWQWRQEYEKQRAEEKQRRNERKAREKATREENKRIKEANRLSDQAWASMQKGNCGKAVELYGQALQLTNFLQWSKNQTVCLTTLHRFDEAYSQWETLINDPGTPDEDIRGMRMAEWNIMYDKGYICPVPPFFNGSEGCYRRPDHKTLDSTYVPLPYIEGKTWTAKQVISSGSFTVTTRDGHEWHSGEVNMTTLNLLDARIRTDKGTVVRFMLPDDTTFALGPESDITFDDFVYDPNESHSSMIIKSVQGSFRFVSGKFSHPDPASKTITMPTGSLLEKFNRAMDVFLTGAKDACMDDAHPCIISTGIRGTDVEFEHDPDGKGSMSEGMDRWWICTYDGDVSVTGDQVYPVPVGECFTRFGHAYRWPVTQMNNHYSIGLFPNYDDSPGAAPTARSQKAQLSVTDFWDSTITPPITGRQ
jgi:hypothetical protein